MNIFDAKIKIWNYFQENDHLDIGKDLKKFFTEEKNKNLAEQIYLSALNDFEKSEFIRKVEVFNYKNDKNIKEDFYVLVKSLKTIECEIKLQSELCFAIAHIINQVCDEIQDDTDRCTPDNITDKEIKNLVHVVNFYKQKLENQSAGPKENLNSSSSNIQNN